MGNKITIFIQYEKVSLKIDISPNKTIRELKRIICEKFEIKKDSQTLLLNDIALSDFKTLSSYNIHNNFKIKLIINSTNLEIKSKKEIIKEKSKEEEILKEQQKEYQEETYMKINSSNPCLSNLCPYDIFRFFNDSYGIYIDNIWDRSQLKIRELHKMICEFLYIPLYRQRLLIDGKEKTNIDENINGKCLELRIKKCPISDLVNIVVIDCRKK